jgi:hypothetical protein
VPPLDRFCNEVMVILSSPNRKQINTVAELHSMHDALGVADVRWVSSRAGHGHQRRAHQHAQHAEIGCGIQARLAS